MLVIVPTELHGSISQPLDLQERSLTSNLSACKCDAQCYWDRTFKSAIPCAMIDPPGKGGSGRWGL